jgi:uroporphyrinogen-III synthase
MSLAGKTVLVTRRREQSAELVDLLERGGATVVVVPVIEILPPESWTACDGALDRLRSYDAVLLTSANAARSFLGRGVERGISFDGINVIAIGEASRSAAATQGVRCATEHAFASARDLARHLLVAPVNGRQYLFPCGDLARGELPETLRRAGARVDRVEVYRTVAPPPEAVEPARNLLTRGKADVVVFASPSAVRNLCDLMGDGLTAALRCAVVAVIGSTTETAARECGLDPRIVAALPTAPALAAAIENHFT